MGVPATTGLQVTSLTGMNVGDYIVCKYVASSGAVGTFSEFGTSTATEIAVTGASAPSGTFYFVKTAKGLLVSDRVVQHSFTWDAMNTGKIIQGLPTTLEVSGIIRSITGGVAFADENGGKSTTNLGYGAFPINNEWRKYVINFPIELIESGFILDDIFHWSSCRSWTQDTLDIEIGLSSSRISVGGTAIDTIASPSSSTSSTAHGFRPVFEYKE